MNVNQQNPNPLINDINNLFNKSNSGQINQNEILTVEPQKKKKRRPVFKIPPSKKRSISQGRSLNFIHKYYDENFILEEENEDNASDSENKKKEKNFKDVVREVINIRRLIPNKNQEEEKNVVNQNDENNNINKNIEEMKSNEIDKLEENKEEENNNNVIRLSHMGFSLERSSFLPENENNNNNDKNNNEDIKKQNSEENKINNINNDRYNLDDLNIDKNIYEEKKIDLDEISPKIKRNIDMNLDEDDDDKINIDKIDEKLNQKLKLYREKENQNSKNNNEPEIIEQKLSEDIPNPYKKNISGIENDYQQSKSDEIKREKNVSSKPELENKPSNIFSKKSEDIMINNSSISNNLLRESDISNINPKFYEPMQESIKDSIRNLQISDFHNNENNEDKRINMNIEGHDLDKYFKKENEKKEIKIVDSSLRTLKSEENDRNSQQIVDNLEEEEEKNNNIKSNKSGDIKTNSEKLTTINDIITGNNPESESSKKFIKKNSK